MQKMKMEYETGIAAYSDHQNILAWRQWRIKYQQFIGPDIGVNQLNSITA